MCCTVATPSPNDQAQTIAGPPEASPQGGVMSEGPAPSPFHNSPRPYGPLPQPGEYQHLQVPNNRLNHHVNYLPQAGNAPLIND